MSLQSLSSQCDSEKKTYAPISLRVFICANEIQEMLSERNSSEFSGLSGDYRGSQPILGDLRGHFGSQAGRLILVRAELYTVQIPCGSEALPRFDCPTGLNIGVSVSIWLVQRYTASHTNTHSSTDFVTSATCGFCEMSSLTIS